VDAVECRGYEIIAIFDQSFYLPNDAKIEPTLLRKLNRKPHQSFRMLPFSMTSSDPNLDFKVTILFNVK